MDRRLFIKLSSSLTGSVVLSTQVGCTATQMAASSTPVEFTHGVASGDPTATSVMLWARCVPMNQDTSATVTWEMATDAEFANIVRTGTAQSQSFRDYIVKIDVQELTANTGYYYRFSAAQSTSAVGQTRTLPTGTVDKVKFGVFSCSNYPAGFFNPYMEASKDHDIDVVLHLGDYIYEYAHDGYATENAKTIGRTFASDNLGELFTLADYRNRYAIYRTDKGLQALHQNKPFIAVWDDHEVANDTYKSGAENHNEGEGDFFERRAAAVQAYYEWIPIRPPLGDTNPTIYRQFQFGNLVNLMMLDTRVIGRDQQLEYKDYQDKATGSFDTQRFVKDISQPTRSLLGQEQKKWLIDQLTNNTAKWQLLGQQVLMGKMHFPAEIFSGAPREKIGAIIAELAQLKQKSLKGEVLSAQEQKRLDSTMAYNLDAWDGYPVEREIILQTALKANKNLVVIAGDTHNAWSSQLVTETGVLAGVEFATPGVSSPGMEHYLSLSENNAVELASALPILIRDLTYSNLHQRGYLSVTFTTDSTQADWIFVDTILSEDYSVANTHTVRHIA